MTDKERTKLLDELQALPREGRLPFIAGQPRDRQMQFKRLLSPEDIRKLNTYIDLKQREAKKPTYEKWIAEARAGRATSPDAMIEVLMENITRLRPNDAIWIHRIRETASAGSFSKRQQGVIRGIYERYFGSQAE